MRPVKLQWLPKVGINGYICLITHRGSGIFAIPILISRRSERWFFAQHLPHRFVQLCGRHP